MFKFIKIETASGTEAQLNKLQEEGWRVAGVRPRLRRDDGRKAMEAYQEAQRVEREGNRER